MMQRMVIKSFLRPRNFSPKAPDEIFAARETTATVVEVVDVYHFYHHIYHFVTIILSVCYVEKWWKW